MNKTIFETIEESCRILQLPFSSKEFAELAEENAMSEEATQAVAFILEHIQQKKAANTILALLRFSRLPVKNPKTFQNFDFSLLRGKTDFICSLCPQEYSVYWPGRHRENSSGQSVWL